MSWTAIHAFLFWCTLLNYGVLLLWFGVFCAAHAWLFRLHTRWFELSAERFDAVHYAGMACYKIGILLFNLVPLIAVSIITRNGA